MICPRMRGYTKPYEFLDGIHIYRHWITNTLYYALSATVITLVVSVPAGYGLALKRFPGRKLVLSLTLISMIMPAAALVLAQGAGRLVRSRQDRGVVAVLDRRLATAGYRDALLDALPPMRRVVDPAVVHAFLADVTAEPESETVED